MQCVRIQDGIIQEFYVDETRLFDKHKLTRRGGPDLRRSADGLLYQPTDRYGPYLTQWVPYIEDIEREATALRAKINVARRQMIEAEEELLAFYRQKLLAANLTKEKQHDS